MNASYIRRIEISKLWGRRNIAWELSPDVNILSGINGIGKSTIINLVASVLSGNNRLGEHVRVLFAPEEADRIDFDVIRSFDRPLLRGEALDKLSDHNVKTELDWQLYELQRKYLDYQVNIGNRTIDLLQSDDPEARGKATELSAAKRRFQDMLDHLFADTGKKLERSRNEITFRQAGDLLTPYQLSSGEKQILVILLTVLVQDRKPCTLLMDEPEISLHVEWQQHLIALIRELNPRCQVILTTHSPALIMDGWLDAVTEVSDISDDIPVSTP